MIYWDFFQTFCDTVLSLFYYRIFSTSFDINIPILHMSKLKPRDVK